MTKQRPKERRNKKIPGKNPGFMRILAGYWWEALTKKIPSINASIELYKKKSPKRELRVEALDWEALTKKIPSKNENFEFRIN